MSLSLSHTISAFSPEITSANMINEQELGKMLLYWLHFW